MDNQKYNSYKLKKGNLSIIPSLNQQSFLRILPSCKVIKRAKKIIRFAAQKGSKVIIVTARQDLDDKRLFKETFPQGIDIKKVYVERAGNIGKETASENKVEVFKGI